MQRCVFDRHRQPFDEAGALGIGDFGGGEALFNPVERINRRRRWAVVVALQGLDEFCSGTDDCDATYTGFEGKRLVLIFEENHGLARGLKRELAMLRRVVLADRNATVGVAGRRIEHAETEACGEEAAQRSVDFRFCDEVLVHGIDESWIGLPFAEAALEIGAGFYCSGGGVGHIRGEVVTGIDVGDGGAVTDDIAVKVPGVAQVIAQEHGVRAGGRSVDCVVGAHDGLSMGLRDGGAEGRQIGVLEIVRRHIDIVLMAGRLGAAVYGIVLRGGDQLQVFGIVALYAGDKRHAHAAGEKRIFTVGLLAAAPARVAKDIDVRSPEGEAEEHLMVVFAHGLVVLGARFGGDGFAHAMHEAGVPGGCHADDLRKVGGVAGKSDAVQTFVPPIVFGNAEARDSRGVIAHLRDFFLKSHAADEVVDSLIDRGERGS